MSSFLLLPLQAFSDKIMFGYKVILPKDGLNH